jgi:uncharacterized protein YrrD
MFYKAKALENFLLKSLDGEIGEVEEFYFDDKHWAIRYLVANTGNWLTGREILISPHAILSVKKDEQQILIDLTKKQIEESPSLDHAKSLSRQFEETYYSYYGWPVYWGGPYMWGLYPYIERNREKNKTNIHAIKNDDPNLRRMRDVGGSHLQGTDGEIGSVEDFIIDDQIWSIRYLVINTSNWWFGKKVLISPKWIDRVSWVESKVFLNLTRDEIRQSPEYTGETMLTREYEIELHQHYNRQGYWVEELPENIFLG